MKIAISPCPNDTFLFHAWITGFVGVPPEVTFADIQTLNELACKGEYSLMKLSFHAFSHVCETYQLLPIGAALGFNCGPKLIAKTPFCLEDLPKKRIAIPGNETTAHLLLKRLLPQPKEKLFCLYHEVTDLIDNHSVDCGLIIHETRFTFARRGLVEIVDLGELWKTRFALPLPLGGLAVRRDFPKKEALIYILQQSLQFARANPKVSHEFILQHSQEKAIDIVQQHIATYVNQESEWLSESGKRAIEILTGLCLENLLYLPKKAKR